MSKPLEPVQEDGGYANIDSAPPGSGLHETPSHLNESRNKYDKRESPGVSRSGTSPLQRSIIAGSVADTDDTETQMKQGRN